MNDSWPSPNMGELPKLLTLVHINFTMNYLTDWFISFAGIYQVIDWAVIDCAQHCDSASKTFLSPAQREQWMWPYSENGQQPQQKDVNRNKMCRRSDWCGIGTPSFWRIYNISEVRGITLVQNMPSWNFVQSLWPRHPLPLRLLKGLGINVALVPMPNTQQLHVIQELLKQIYKSTSRLWFNRFSLYDNLYVSPYWKSGH